MSNALRKTKYYVVALTARSLYSLGIADKNSSIFQKKRALLLGIIPDAKLITEVSAVAHTFYHPDKKPEDIASIKEHLRSLLVECDTRGMDKYKTIRWARMLIEKGYEPTSLSTRKHEWKPAMSAWKSFHKLAQQRTTNRYVLPEKFDRALLYRTLECAVQAPSACNKQGWRFIIVDDPTLISTIAGIKRQQFIRHFPYIVCACFDKSAYMGLDMKMTPYLDIGAALMNLTTAATSLGLATCWMNFALDNIGKRRHKELRQLLKLPTDLVPVSLVGIGMPAHTMEKPPRERLSFYLPLERTRP